MISVKSIKYLLVINCANFESMDKKHKFGLPTAFSQQQMSPFETAAEGEREAGSVARNLKKR